MTTSLPDPPTVLTVRHPEDILAMVPVALGFHPTESLVLLTFGRARNMPLGMPTGELAGGFHARVDMPPTIGDIAAVVHPIRQAVRRHRAQLGAVVVYSADVELGRLTGAAAEAALTGAGLDLVEVLQMHDGQWWTFPAVGLPRHWRPERHDVDLTCHPILAGRVYDGHVVLESRQAVADSLRSTDEVDARRVAAAVDAVTDRLCHDLTGSGAAAHVADREVIWLEGLLAGAADEVESGNPTTPLPPPDVARMLTLAQVTTVRDRVCSALDRRTASRQLATWSEVVRRSPPELVGGAAAVLALVAWLAGDGALAWCAVDRCREVEPDNTLVAHVAAALQNAVPPSAWEQHRSAS